MFSGQPVYPRTRVLHATYCKLPDLPRVDRDRCRLGVDDGIQECHVRVVGQRVEGDAVDRRQGERVEASQVKEPVAADHAVGHHRELFKAISWPFTLTSIYSQLSITIMQLVQNVQRM